MIIVDRAGAHRWARINEVARYTQILEKRYHIEAYIRYYLGDCNRYTIKGVWLYDIEEE